MSVFLWSEQFSIGIPELDAQHRALLELVEALGASRGVETQAEAARHVEKVRDYARYHFGFEEAAWKARGLPTEARGAHAQQHLRFREDVDRAWALDLPLAQRVEQLHEFLVSWLILHIVGEDRVMARRAGAALPSAAEPEAAEAVLLSAVRNLHRDLAARNAQLAATNERLEAQVAERTASLTRANEALAAEREALLKMVTQLDEARLRLLQTEHLVALGQLAAGVAHEVNNPLAIVAANVEAIGHEAEDLFLAAAAHADTAVLELRRQEVGSMVADATAGLLRIKGIVNALRAFTRTEAQGWQQADLNQGLESTLAVLAHEFGERITVERELGALGPVLGEHGQLNQAFLEVLRNAVQAIANRGRITVRTRSEGAFAVVQVSDTGRGMSEEALARAMDPFYSTREVGKGLGLGLSMAWSTVRQHGGHLALESRPGQGTTVTLRLPFDGPPPGQAPAPPPA